MRQNWQMWSGVIPDEVIQRVIECAGDTERASTFDNNDDDAVRTSRVSEDNTIIARIEKSEDLVIRCLMANDEVTNHTWEQVGNLCDLKKFKFGKYLMKLNNPWCIKTPKGWSVQIKNPANNFENDVHILEGVVDTDEYGAPVLFPFVWTGTEAGEFVIPKGTPIAQIIPFKREKISLRIKETDEDRIKVTHEKLKNRIFNRYKLEFWHKRKKYDKYDVDI